MVHPMRRRLIQQIHHPRRPIDAQPLPRLDPAMHVRDAGVLEGPRSLVWRQAAHRRTAMRGILAWVLEGSR